MGACSSWDDWEVGRHGLIAEFQCPNTGQGHYATYLPEIAEREGWSKEETIDSLARKSGYRGALTPALRADMRVTRYQSLFKQSYADYLAAESKMGGWRQQRRDVYCGANPRPSRP